MARDPLASPVRVFADVGNQPGSYRVGDDVACLSAQIFIIAQAMVVEAGCQIVPLCRRTWLMALADRDLKRRRQAESSPWSRVNNQCR